LYAKTRTSAATVVEVLTMILNICSREELEDTSSSDDEGETRTVADPALMANNISARRQKIKIKNLAVGKMRGVYQLWYSCHRPRVVV